MAVAKKAKNAAAAFRDDSHFSRLISFSTFSFSLLSSQVCNGSVESQALSEHAAAVS
jgi:hypothetical protein